MRNPLCVVAALAALLCFLCSSAKADDYPYQAHPLTLDGTVSAVDMDRDRVILAGDDGRRYTLDTSQTDITLPDGNRAGMTNDLAVGMRVHVAGQLLSQNIVEADQLRVLALQGRRLAEPTPPLAPALGEPITLHGNVQAADPAAGSFVVRIKEPKDHIRTVFVSDETDMSGMGRGLLDPLPVQVGDRVTVAGTLAENGSVQADAVSLGRALPVSAAAQGPGHVLSGRVTGTSNRFSSRDLEVQVSPERQVKVEVPHGVTVMRDGKPISVHEINKDERVRVVGSYDGDHFRATHIDDYPDGE